MRISRILISLRGALLLLLCVAWVTSGLAQDRDILPAGWEPDPDIPSTADVLGFEPGDRHVYHHELVEYFMTLAEASPRVSVEVTGRTHGGRPLILAYFHSDGSSEAIETARQQRREGGREGDGPLVVWLGYSVHGNEASGAPAAMETAWYLAASQDEKVQALLDEAVIVMEPALNPDGIDRFSHWVNNHRGNHPSADPNDREHRESWPNGRTNYYWFDLNRDWLPLVHPESRARLEHYYQWLPHVVTDVHEMGHGTTYFFQPGVPERNNPLTPEDNFELTARLAEYHARALEDAGEPWFTRELFDDYYAGKGSTYPDLTGGIGILFEQASSRGHVMDTPHGKRTFRDAIANQVATSLSTLEGSLELADELKDFQLRFFEDARAQGRGVDHAGWVIGDGGDKSRALGLVELLIAHDLEVHAVDGPVTIGEEQFDNGWVVPADQSQYLLARSMLDPLEEFESEVFYDVSTWWLPAAFDLPVETVGGLPAHSGTAMESAPDLDGYLPEGNEPVAWIIPWNQMLAPVALDRLLESDARVRVAKQPLELETDRGTGEFLRGALVLPTGLDQPDLDELLAPMAESGLRVYGARGGLVDSGPDLGSPSLRPLEPVRPVLLTGPGLSPLSAGQIWHWFDHFLERPLVRVEWHRLQGVDLADYTHVILPDGDYSLMPDWLKIQLKTFVEAGGTVIGKQQGAGFASGLEFEPELSRIEPEADAENDEEAAETRRAYDDHSDDFARKWIGGAALEMDLDITHPLGFGHDRDRVPVFRRGMTRLAPSDNAYAMAGRYTDEPVLSGYLSDERTEQLSGSPALLADHRGQGLVIRIADDYLFRGYHAGTWRMFANAIYFSGVIDSRELPE